MVKILLLMASVWTYASSIVTSGDDRSPDAHIEISPPDTSMPLIEHYWFKLLTVLLFLIGLGIVLKFLSKIQQNK